LPDFGALLAVVAHVSNTDFQEANGFYAPLGCFE
jgi:hypothetical protein